MIHKLDIGSGKAEQFANFTKRNFVGFNGDAIGPSNAPCSITTDGFDIYVSDFLDSTVKKITLNGEMSDFAGSTQGNEDGLPGKFKYPQGMLFLDGIMYVADSGNYRIAKIAKDGTVSLPWQLLTINMNLGILIALVLWYYTTVVSVWMHSMAYAA